MTRLFLSLLTAATLAAIGASAFAQAPLATVEGVEDRALRERLQEIVGTADGEATDERWRNRDRARRAADRARRFLDSEGYYGALVDPRIDEDRQPVVRVEAGERFTFRAAQVSFDSPPGQEREPGEATAAEMGIAAGDPVRARSVLDGEAAVLDVLRESGWIEAASGDHDIVVDHASGDADAEFIFQTGPFRRFGEPEQAGGLAELRPGYVARLATYDVGDPAARSDLADYTQRLQGLDSVSVAEARLRPDCEQTLCPVDVRMEPAPRHVIELGAQYSTTEGIGARGEWARRNMFGGDETLTLTAQAATLASGAGANLHLPHWRSVAQTLELYTEVFAERTDAFDQNRFTVGAALSRPLTDTLTGSIGAEGQIAEITDAEGTRQLNTLTLPAALAYDDRDSRLDPTEGIAGELRVQPGYSFGDDAAQYVRTEFAARTYFDLSERLILAVQGRVGSLLGADAEQVPADIRYYSGGGGSVRGYGYQDLSPRRVSPETGEEEIFGGRSLLEGAFEARYRYSDRIGVVAFVDAGAASEKTYPDLSDLRYGAGVGVRYYPGFGPIRVDVATPLDRRDGDDPVQIYISIGQAF